MLKFHVNRYPALFLCAVLCILSFAGCGAASNEAVVKTADSFLSAAKDADLPEAAKFASPEVIDQLGWSDSDIDDVINDFFAAIAGYGVSEEELMAIPEVQVSVDDFVARLKEVIVSSYEINSSSVQKTADGYTLSASVQTFSEEDFYSLLDDELITEVTEFSSNYAQEHSGETVEGSSEDIYTSLYKALVPFIMGKLSENLDAALAHQSPQSWNITVGKVDGSLVVTGVDVVQ